MKTLILIVGIPTNTVEELLMIDRVAKLCASLRNKKENLENHKDGGEGV